MTDDSSQSEPSEKTEAQNLVEVQQPPAPSFEGIAALMLVLGVPESRVPEVWRAMKWMAIPRDPDEAIQIIQHAFDLVQRGLPGPDSPEAVTDVDRDKEEVAGMVADIITKQSPDKETDGED